MVFGENSFREVLCVVSLVAVAKKNSTKLKYDSHVFFSPAMAICQCVVVVSIIVDVDTENISLGGWAVFRTARVSWLLGRGGKITVAIGNIHPRIN